MGKKNTESKVEPSEIEKTNVRYNLLRKAYKMNNDTELGQVLGITKGGVSWRRKNAKWNEEEILYTFPNINEDWVRTDDINEIRTLPVRTDANGSQALEQESRSAQGKDPISREQVKEYLERIEEFVRMMRDNL